MFLIDEKRGVAAAASWVEPEGLPDRT